MNELKEWLKSRKEKPRSVKELSEIFKEVPYKTVEGWVHQNKVPAKKELREKLYQITKIDKYMPDKLKEQIIAKVENSIYASINSLEPLTQSSALRDYFRKKIKKSDVAYLSSILEALLDEKRFQMWNSFQKVNMKGGIRNGGKDNL